MTVTCTPPTAPSSSSLTTIPPEILLRIISFLPGPGAFVALSQTSPGLRQFVREHATGICSSYIRCHFFSSPGNSQGVYPRCRDFSGTPGAVRYESSDGWLVPGDRDFFAEAEAFLGRKKRCYTEHRERLGVSLQRRIDTWVIPDFDDKYYRCVGTERLLSEDGDSPHHNFLLSTPAPLYLAYLEEYAWDVENFTWQAATTDSDSDNNSDLDDEPSRHDLLKRLRRPDARWRISAYTIRPFLRKLDAAILNDCGCCVSSVPNARSSPPPTPSAETAPGFAARILARSGLRRMFIFPFSAGREGKEPGARLLFGELPPDDTDAVAREKKWGLGRESRSAVVLWTIVSGREERLAPSPVTEATRGRERKEQKIISLVRDLKDRTKTMGRRARLSLVSSSSKALSFVRRACLRKHKGFALLK